MRAYILWLSCFLVLLALMQIGLAENRHAKPAVLTETVYYVAGPNETAHAMDLYIPSNATKKPLSLILFVHGGAWAVGSKEQCPALFFTNSGFAFASANYRFTDRAKFPAQLEDVKAAVRWLRAHAGEYGYDPNKIGAFGHSAGGHLVALLGTTGGIDWAEGKLGNPTISSKVQAVCDWCGPTDFKTLIKQAGNTNELDLKSNAGPVAKFLGGLPETRKQEAYNASPVNFVSSDDPPFLIMHGDNDRLVPLEQSTEFCKVLKDARVPVELKVLKGAGHNFGSADNFATVANFFNKTLR